LSRSSRCWASPASVRAWSSSGERGDRLEAVGECLGAIGQFCPGQRLESLARAGLRAVRPVVLVHRELGKLPVAVQPTQDVVVGALQLVAALAKARSGHPRRMEPSPPATSSCMPQVSPDRIWNTWRPPYAAKPRSVRRRLGRRGRIHRGRSAPGCRRRTGL
jgi:hypothetical protein